MESMQAWQQRQDQQEGLLSELKDLMATPTLGRTSLSSAVRQSEDHLGLTCSEAEAQRSKVIFSPLICSILSFKFIALRVTSFDASRQASSASRAPRPRKASSCPHPTPPHPTLVRPGAPEAPIFTRDFPSGSRPEPRFKPRVRQSWRSTHSRNYIGLYDFRALFEPCALVRPKSASAAPRDQHRTRRTGNLHPGEKDVSFWTPWTRRLLHAREPFGRRILRRGAPAMSRRETRSTRPDTCYGRGRDGVRA